MSEEATPAGVEPGDGAEQRGEADPAPAKWPVGFIVLLIAAALYLGLRAVQMIGWLIDWIR